MIYQLRDGKICGIRGAQSTLLSWSANNSGEIRQIAVVLSLHRPISREITAFSGR